MIALPNYEKVSVRPLRPAPPPGVPTPGEVLVEAGLYLAVCLGLAVAINALGAWLGWS